jgi:hypothetical protein
MADGNTHGYDSLFPRVPSIGMIERRLSGLPHSSNRDDVYKGYFIPKGQILHQPYILLFRDFAINHLV